MVFYFYVYGAMFCVALWKAAVGLYELLRAGWRALVRHAKLKEAQKSSVPLKSEEGPRDYKLP